MFVLLLLIQLYKFKIIWIAACFLVVESIDAHVYFLQLFRSIIERCSSMLQGCHVHYHIGSEDGAVRAFNTFRLNLKTLLIVLSFLGFDV